MSNRLFGFVSGIAMFGLVATSCSTSGPDHSSAQNSQVAGVSQPISLAWPPPEPQAAEIDAKRPRVDLDLKVSTVFADPAEVSRHWQKSWGPAVFLDPPRRMGSRINALVREGHPVYLSLKDTTAAKPWVAMLKTQPIESYVEVRGFAPSLFDDLGSSATAARFPRIISPRSQVERSDIKKAYDTFGSKNLHAVATHLPVYYSTAPSFWQTIDVIYDTFFDLPQDVQGASPVKINYPWDARLVLSTERVNIPKQKGPAHLTAVLSSMLVTYVQAMEKELNSRKKEKEEEEDGKEVKAPLKSRAVVDMAIVNQWGQLEAGERDILKHFAAAARSGGTLRWPWAWVGNGDPWSNEFMPSSNSLPVVGIITENAGEFFIALTNISDSAVSASVAGPKPLKNPTILTAGPQDKVTLPLITIQPYSVVILKAAR